MKKFHYIQNLNHYKYKYWLAYKKFGQSDFVGKHSESIILFEQ